MNDQDVLASRIASAFVSVPYPGDENLIEHPCLECNTVAASFRGVKWTQIPQELPRLIKTNNFGFISLLSRRAFHYYLPGLMTAVLRDYRGSANVFESLITGLSSSTSDDWKKMIDKIEPRGVVGHSPESIIDLKARLRQLDASGDGKTTDSVASLLSPMQTVATVDFLRYIKAAHPDDDPLDRIGKAIVNLGSSNNP